MKDMYELKEMLCKELEEYTRKGKMSAGDLEVIHKLTDTIKNIGKIEMLEEEGSYSQDDGMMGGGYGNRSYRDGDGYDDGAGNSYRGRRRDSRGRYSRNDGRGYSYEDGKHEMIAELEDMMGDAKSDREREAIRRCLDTIRNA